MLTRRDFLRSTSAFALTPFLPMGRLVEDEQKAGTKRRKTLVLIFLRGGMDGLNLIVPHGENAYYEARPWIAVPRPGEANGAIDLDGQFGLHPFAAPLAPLFEDGRAVAIHAIGNAANTRSHFEEQDIWETGVLQNTARSDGWMNRHLQTTKGDGPVRAVTVGETLPRILRGKSRALAIRGLSDFSLDGNSAAADALVKAFDRAHRADSEERSRELLDETGRDALTAFRELRAVAEKPYKSKVEYPSNDLARRLREVARLVKADVGLEIAELDYGGWDTHQNQGSVGGPFSQLVRTLSGAVAAFESDLEERSEDVLLLAVSEFGRTIRQNGTAGTDHGWANCALAFGGALQSTSASASRKLIGTWPGLERDQRREGRDLAHTTDFRDLIANAVGGHLGNPRLDLVLPEYEARPLPVV